ncbi:hypothetical protein Tsubulata_034634 [Turnera subulata]|uniref:Uncharacterized protein n=1 Tax=Turnera subulata TaxID=218843 RepID=A0A9Q0F231_9ROSI|nr:hypothetical protein Tsubulata_034634 [Turnera subulata]
MSSSSKTFDTPLRVYEPIEFHPNTQSSKQPTNDHHQNFSPAKPEIYPNEAPSQSSSNMRAETSDRSSYDDNCFFFSHEDSNSGYLGCIVPDSCLRPPSSSTTTNPKTNKKFNASNDQNLSSSTTSSIQNQSHCDNYSLPMDVTNAATKAFSPAYFPCLDEFNNSFWPGDHKSWEFNSGDLSVMLNNPLMAEDMSMETSYPSIGNPSYNELVPQVAPSNSCSPSFPPAYGEAVDFGYSLF